MVYVSEIQRLIKLASNRIKFLIAFSFRLPFLLMDLVLGTFMRFTRLIFGGKEESLLNEIVVLVGAGKSPVGIHLSIKLSQANAKVVMIDKPSESANEGVVRKIKESGELVFFYECDVSDRHACKSVVETIEKDVGRITMLFHGNLLMNRATHKDLIYGYVHLVNAILPRMVAAKHGQIVFMSLLNSQNDYSHNHFVQGFFDSMLSEVRAIRSKGGKVNMSFVQVHKKVLNDFTRDYDKFGIFGLEEAESIAQSIIKGVRQKKLLISMPALMVHTPRILDVLPRKTQHDLIDLLYRVY